MGDACPPLAKWSDMIDGTYELTDLLKMHDVMDEIAQRLEEERGRRN